MEQIWFFKIFPFMTSTFGYIITFTKTMCFSQTIYERGTLKNFDDPIINIFQ